jgi:hypothetical protein
MSHRAGARPLDRGGDAVSGLGPRRLVRRPRVADFTSTLRSERVTSRVGLWLGVCFGVAFLTGLISHNHYLAHPWLPLPTRPVWGYRVTQALHVLSGTAAIPLLLVKLWSVYPRLFEDPPRRPVGPVLRHLAERVSIAVLVAASLTQLATGLANESQWYPWRFSFRATHYALAWVAIGALLVHIAVKLPVIGRGLSAPPDDPAAARGNGATPSRRDLLRATWGAAGLAVVAAAGSAVPGLRRVSVFGVRTGSGPQGVPINTSARAADVVALALRPDYRLAVVHDGDTRTFSRTDLEAMVQRTHVLPIACVEGWSADGTWTGVRLRDLLDEVGAPREVRVRLRSLQPHGPFRVSELPANFVDDPLTLLALRLDGEPLALDHGYPCRLIAPNRPGVFQTKWLASVEVLG